MFFVYDVYTSLKSFYTPDIHSLPHVPQKKHQTMSAIPGTRQATDTSNTWENIWDKVPTSTGEWTPDFWLPSTVWDTQEQKIG